MHDDQRFVGNVGWRQHEQTFDALRAQWATPKIKTDLTYAAQVNRVFGPDSPQGKWEGDVVLANFAYTLPVGTLSVFDYYLDIDNVAAASSNTVGVKLAGSKPLGKLTATYALAYAQQAEAGAEHRRSRLGLRPHRRRADLREIRRWPRLTSCSAATGSRVSRRRSPRCTRSKVGPTSFSRRRRPASRTDTSASRIRSASAERSRTSRRRLFITTTRPTSAARSSARSSNLQLVARTERMALTAKYADYRADTLFTDTDKFWLSVDYAF